MKLPDLRNFDLAGKTVLLRVDLDVPLKEIKYPDGSYEYKVLDETRLENFIPTAKLILEKGAQYLIILGHIGRYQEESQGISTLGLYPYLCRLLNEQIEFWPDTFKENNQLDFKPHDEQVRIHLFDNLRLYPGEEENDSKFAQKIASYGNFYINEAFAVSHREHASIVGLPKLLPHAAGLSLLKEVEVLSGVLENPKRPVVVILGGVKEDKLEVVPQLAAWADWILIGGKLPILIQNSEFRIQNSPKVFIAGLNEEGKDITLETVEKFKKIIEGAGTIIWSGPLGKVEEPEFEKGTRIFAEAMVKSRAFKIIGGGDTEAALTKLNLVEKINFVSSGGGAMLEFLANGDLPGLKALRV